MGAGLRRERQDAAVTVASVPARHRGETGELDQRLVVGQARDPRGDVVGGGDPLALSIPWYEFGWMRSRSECSIAIAVRQASSRERLGEAAAPGVGDVLGDAAAGAGARTCGSWGADGSDCRTRRQRRPPGGDPPRRAGPAVLRRCGSGRRLDGVGRSRLPPFGCATDRGEGGFGGWLVDVQGAR